MDKRAFLNQYLPRIGTHFNDTYFRDNDDVKVVKTNLTFGQFLQFYIPRSAKNGVYDPRSIELREVDPESVPVILDRARLAPDDWDLPARQVLEPLWPIPIATDTVANCTLILDSNHLLANLKDSEASLPVVQIIGPNLENLVPDFKIIKNIRCVSKPNGQLEPKSS